MLRTLFSCLQEKVQENRGVSGLRLLPRGHWSALVGVRSIRFDQGPRSEFLLHLLQSFVCAELLQVCSHRRASVGDGRPSACHGCAVACIGQPPPPSAPGPVLGGWQGRSPAAAVAGRLPASGVLGGGPRFPRAAARPVGHSVLNLAGLLISFPIHQRMPLLCVDPLPCSRSACCSVRLYW
jgi:hypothetical protein